MSFQTTRLWSMSCVGGERAELTASRNLGDYLIHVIGRKDLKSELDKPEKADKGEDGYDKFVKSFLVPVYGSLAAATEIWRSKQRPL